MKPILSDEDAKQLIKDFYISLIARKDYELIDDDEKEIMFAQLSARKGYEKGYAERDMLGQKEIALRAKGLVETARKEGALAERKRILEKVRKLQPKPYPEEYDEETVFYDTIERVERLLEKLKEQGVEI